MSQSNIQSIMRNFNFRGNYVGADEMNSGNINTTYKLIFDDEGTKRQYTLQRINHYVFKRPKEVMKNVEAVTSFIKGEYVKKGYSPERRVLEVIKTKRNTTYFHDEEGYYWRAYVFIDGATPHDQIKKPEHFYEAGRGFGEFQKMLNSFPADELFETIPNFHNTTKRFYNFVAAIDADKAGRVKDLEQEIDYVFNHRKLLCSINSLIASGKLPLRVTHNDTKLNNVLIDDETDKAICVIDLDTVMPGSSLYDFGDAIRYGANTAQEDEPDTSKIGLDLNLFELFARGFLKEAGDILTDEEIKLMPQGAMVMTGELIVRFLTDYIDGDLYFKTNYPDHNLVRTHAQMALLDDMEKKLDQMNTIIDKILKER